jgi:hypothetical protein
MKSQQFLNEEHDDHEASMAKAELLQIAKNAMETYKMFQDGDELPGWVSSKLTIANDHLNSVHEHMTYRKVNNVGNPTWAGLDETASSGASSAGGVATSMGGGAGFGRSVFMKRETKKDKKK